MGHSGCKGPEAGKRLMCLRKRGRPVRLAGQREVVGGGAAEAGKARLCSRRGCDVASDIIARAERNQGER